MALYDLENRIRAFGEKRRLNVGTAAKPRWIDNVHAGDDYAETYGHDNVYAVQAGTVTFSGWSSTFGWHLKVRAPDGTIIGYHSLEETPAPKRGQTVRRGDYVGRTGDTASGASGNHVHIQADTPQGKAFNPRPYIAGFTFTPTPTPGQSNSKPIEEDDMYSDADRTRDEKVASQVAAIADTVQAIHSGVFTTEPTSRGNAAGGVLASLREVDAKLNAVYDAQFSEKKTSRGTPGGTLVTLKAILDQLKVN